MYIPIVFAFLVLQCTVCFCIRVPVDWSNESEVNKNEKTVSTTKNDESKQHQVSNEYFQYAAKKPQFFIDLTAANGAQSPKHHYNSHPILPYTGLPKPVLGKHRIQDSQKYIYRPDQTFVRNSDGSSYARPASTSFEIFHPYKAKEPALQELYKDPVLEHIRNDIRDSSHKSQKYQNTVGEPDITRNEYSENPEQTDRRKLPQKNIPTEYEVHKAERRPVYYMYPPQNNFREDLLNKKLRHPWNQNIAKVAPIHYRPIKKHLHGLRQQHALKYDDEHNEYPQLIQQGNSDEQPDGYDIYEKGKEKFLQLSEYFDDTINKTAQGNKSIINKDEELQKEDTHNHGILSETEDEFVPIKNYAQVRKTETTKHLPKEAAFHDAESLEEIQNAPRLREAVKSKKAQIVYSEEGYEDSAYDHAGEQKHASDHESHGGYLKENETSRGRFKIPSISIDHSDAKGSKYRNQILHGNKWNNDKKESEDESESDYYESEEKESDGDVVTNDSIINNENDRNRRNTDHQLEQNLSENTPKNNNQEIIPDTLSINDEKLDLVGHGIIKRETSIETSDNNNKQTFKTSDTDIKNKYPYYFKNLNVLTKNSPLRYAENFELIPKKTDGGSEFYDSRSMIKCPEVEDNVDPIPEKLKKDGHPDDEENHQNSDSSTIKGEGEFNNLSNKQRLHGLGDKIDCFKAKYFGENPLDNPFFQEGLIENPEPVRKPNLAIFNTKQKDQVNNLIKYTSNTNFINVPQNKQNLIQDIKKIPAPQSNTYRDTLTKISKRSPNGSGSTTEQNLIPTPLVNESYKQHSTAAEIPKVPSNSRKKRATPFMYEPYKILRDSQIQDSKKTTTTSNISPLIKQLQSSRVIDKVTTNQDKDQGTKNISNTKIYKDISKSDRQGNFSINKNSSDTSFIDVNTDTRRGEPRYELRSVNHKEQYSPIGQKQVISMNDHKTQSTKNTEEKVEKNTESTTHSPLRRSKRRKPTVRPFFDVSKYLPQSLDTQNFAASNVVRKIMRTTTPGTTTEKIKLQTTTIDNIEDDDDDDDDEDDDDDDDGGGGDDDVDNKVLTTTTTTTTVKPLIKNKLIETTVEPKTMKDLKSPKLYHITRFRDFQPDDKIENFNGSTEEPLENRYNTEHSSPRYREKKRKSTKSTLVTDTKSYGSEDDDLIKEEVDKFIGVKQNMDEYIPLYERVVNKINRMKDEEKKNRQKHNYDSNTQTHDDDDRYGFEDSDEDDEDDNDDDDDIDEDDDEGNSDNNNEDDSDSNNAKDNVQNDDSRIRLPVVTTSEPTKRTLAKTTEAPATTTETRSAKLELKPIILKKKIEIHKELPVDKSSPNITQFKHDVKEIEVIKEMPPKPRKINKNSEALDLYRDEKLAEEINKLGEIEIFKENLDIKSGPRHGGNYRSITNAELQREKLLQDHGTAKKDDVETSPTETRNQIKERPSRRRGRYSKQNNPEMKSSEINAKFIELSDTYDTTPKSMHGGNLKQPHLRDQRRNNKSEKYIEIDEAHKEKPSDMHGGNFKSYGNGRNPGRHMHGGNYRSAKLISNDGKKLSQTRKKTDTSSKATLVTTTPSFILDPSKRMYYYVDA